MWFTVTGQWAVILGICTQLQKSTDMRKRGFGLFHLNLAFSSIPEHKRKVVIERCYWPLLTICGKHNFRFGIELTGWTLREISRLDPQWVTEFTKLLREDKCELIGSGYCQIIGPLVPAQVNEWNQTLGIECYMSLLGKMPELALVNEMAFSEGLIPSYLSAGYKGIIIDCRNYLTEPNANTLYEVPRIISDRHGNSIPVLWIDSVAFQQFQRIVHAETSELDYLATLRSALEKCNGPFPVYASDGEVFDYRPGRFTVEAHLNDTQEWDKIATLCAKLDECGMIDWTSPSSALAESLRQPAKPNAGHIASAKHPIPVKKQLKYNISRWAISGRDDLWLNTKCHDLAQRIANDPAKVHDRDFQTSICELWASDFRTHITSDRWEKLLSDIEVLESRLGQETERRVDPVAWQQGEASTTPVDPTITSETGTPFTIDLNNKTGSLSIQTAALRVTFSLLRGLTVRELSFENHGFIPILGNIPQGTFDDIDLAVDWYFGGVVIELPLEHRRLTDLSKAEPALAIDAEGNLVIQHTSTLSVGGQDGSLTKIISISPSAPSITFKTDLKGIGRPHGTVRIGHVALNPKSWDTSSLYYETHNGGRALERFLMTENFSHFEPVSSIVSCRTGLGATTGHVRIGDSQKSVLVSWDPAKGAAFPGIHHRMTPEGNLTRLIFSLAELDDTTRTNGRLLPFSFTVTAD